MTDREYSSLCSELSPKSPVGKDCFYAFLVGGTICTLGQIMQNIYLMFHFTKDQASVWASISLIFLSVLLTGLGYYDDLAKIAGSGTLVPITGFANAVAAPAIEFQTEGFISGVGAKMFTIAGPVIVYGTMASVLYGFVYWLITM